MHVHTYIVTLPYFKMIVIIYVPVHVSVMIIIPQSMNVVFHDAKVCLFIIDGIMKKRRDVCAASEAGFTKYEGLPGVIRLDVSYHLDTSLDTATSMPRGSPQ